MPTRTTSAIILGVILLLAVTAAMSNWYFGPIGLAQASLLEAYRPSTAGRQMTLLKKWRAGTNEGEVVLSRFTELYNAGTLQEQNLTGRPDFVLVLHYGQEAWTVQVYEKWFRILRPNKKQYTVYVPDWPGFRWEYLDDESMAQTGMPFLLSQAINGYMHQRMSGNLAALAAYLLPESYYQLSLLYDQGPSRLGETIRGYEVKEVKKESETEFGIVIRVFRTSPTITWEEEYTGRKMADRYRLSLHRQWEYVIVHS